MAQEVVSPFSIDADWDHLYVDGERRGAPDCERISVENPATREEITTVPAGTREDVEAAFDAATVAQEEWAARPPQARAEVIQRAIGIVDEHAEAIMGISIAESGGTHGKAHVEVEEIAPGAMAEAASLAMRRQGRHAQSVVPGKENEVRREPVGTVGVITPWNFPFNLTLRAVAPAIAVGNSVVLKPAEDTPILGGLVVARIFEEAGLPDGVLNVVPGHGEEAGDAVAAHPDADAVAFTGSSEVGRQVMKRAADHLATPALELGGNNPYVVLEDADLDVAVDAGVFGSFIHQGQVCISINRHLVHESLYDEYVDRLADRAAGLNVGDPSAPESHVGPIINESQRDQIVEYIDRTVDEGATLEVGGDHDGLFVEPTVLSGVSNEMAAACNEHFGPVAPVIPFSSDEEATEIANDTEYGLAASIISEDLGRAKRLADDIEAGMVHINDQPVNDDPHIPFGGVKQSGVGRYNTDAIMDEFTELKWVSVQREPREFPF
jgi:aldehyde dehydrogenase (NAD+)